MSASLAWVSWKPAIGRPNCSRGAGVVDRGVQAVPGRAQRAPDDAVPRLGQAGQRRLEPARLGQPRVAGQPHVVEHDLAGGRGAQRHLVPDLPGRDARACPSARRSRATPSSVRAQITATSATGALVIHILVPCSTQSSPSRRARVGHRRRVGAVVGLGQPEAADRLAGRHRRQPPLLLLLAAVPPDRVHRQRALHADQASGRPSRPPPAPGRPARTRPRRRRRSRTRSGACRAGRACRTRGPARGPGRWPSLVPVGDVRADPVVDQPAHDGADLAAPRR